MNEESTSREEIIAARKRPWRDGELPICGQCLMAFSPTLDILVHFPDCDAEPSRIAYRKPTRRTQ